MAATLWAGRGGAVSHRAAARLRGLDGIRDRLVEVIAAQRWGEAPEDVIVHFTRSLSNEDIELIGSLRVTTIERTLIDLAAVVRPARLEIALDSALRTGLTEPGRVLGRLRQLGSRGRAGAARLKELLAERDSNSSRAESPLESEFLKLMRGAPLPPPLPQLEVREGDRFLARVDFAYPDRKIAIELDGYQWHSGHLAWESDRLKDNRLQAAGWRVLRFSKKAVRGRSSEVIDQLLRVYDGSE
jgi:hypothetical protein